MQVYIKERRSLQSDLLRMGTMFLALVALMIVIDMWTCNGAAWAAGDFEFVGDIEPLTSMLQGMVRLARVTMMFVAALLGIICGVMWYTGQQQAQGMLQKFFVAVFFIFGATAILDAILGMTIGTIKIDANMQKESKDQWMDPNIIDHNGP